MGFARALCKEIRQCNWLPFLRLPTLSQQNLTLRKNALDNSFFARRSSSSGGFSANPLIQHLSAQRYPLKNAALSHLSSSEEAHAFFALDQGIQECFSSFLESYLQRTLHFVETAFLGESACPISGFCIAGRKSNTMAMAWPHGPIQRALGRSKHRLVSPQTAFIRIMVCPRRNAYALFQFHFGLSHLGKRSPNCNCLSPHDHIGFRACILLTLMQFCLLTFCRGKLGDMMKLLTMVSKSSMQWLRILSLKSEQKEPCLAFSYHLGRNEPFFLFFSNRQSASRSPTTSGPCTGHTSCSPSPGSCPSSSGGFHDSVARNRVKSHATFLCNFHVVFTRPGFIMTSSNLYFLPFSTIDYREQQLS